MSDISSEESYDFRVEGRVLLNCIFVVKDIKKEYQNQ